MDKDSVGIEEYYHPKDVRLSKQVYVLRILPFSPEK